MIDSIILRVHNFSKYERSHKIFSAFVHGQIEKGFLGVDEATGEMLEGRLKLGLLYSDSMRFVPITKRVSRRIASSYSDIATFLDEDRDFIEFNFSIPKYFFSSNVFQFLNIYDAGNIKQTWILFNKFLTYFLKHSFDLSETILMEDVEIRRIDFCYNQYFVDKDYCPVYLAGQLPLVAKYQGDDKGAKASSFQPASHKTGWYYRSNDHFFKCYWKGPEFRKNSLPKLMKKGGNPKNLDLGWLNDQADRILRYEIECTHTYMNYFYQQIYHAKSADSDYVQYRNNKYYRRMADIGTYLGPEAVEEFLKGGRTFRMASAWDNYQGIKLAPEIKIHPLQWLAERKEFTFDEGMFYCLWNNFRKKVLMFQLKNVQQNQVINARIDQMVLEQIKKNEMLKPLGIRAKGVTEAGRLKIIAKLCMYEPFYKQKAIMSKPTYYRTQKELKALGISDECQLYDMPLPRTDYWDYCLEFAAKHDLYL